MAQYYQVLTQTDKTVEELRQFYPNIVENHPVPYVATAEQPVQEQQIIVSAGVAASPAIIEQQQIQIETKPQLVIRQPITQPIVLNHQIQGTQLQNQIVAVNVPKNIGIMPQRIATPIRQQIQVPQQVRPQIPVQQVRQPLPNVQRAMVPVQVMQQRQQRPVQRPVLQQRAQQGLRPQQRPAQLAQQRMPQQALPQRNTALNRTVQQEGAKLSPEKYAASITLDPPQQTQSRAVPNSREIVTLADGRHMSVADYKKLLQQKAGSNTIQERLQSAPMLPPEAAKQKQLRQNSSPRSNRGGRQKGRANNPRPQYSELDVNVSQQQSEPQQKWAEQQHPQNLEKNQYVIPPHVPTQPSQNPGPNLPPYILSNQIQQIIASTPESEDSIRMLVVLPDGEQRLITFTLPKEACTIHEILEQVDVQVTPETNITVTEYGNCGLHYLVTVGNPPIYNDEHAPPSEQQSSSETAPPTVEAQENQVQNQESLELEEMPKEQPKFIDGMLAVCGYCGYLSEDFNRCIRCRKKLPEDVKSRPSDEANCENQNGKVTSSNPKIPINITTRKKPKPKPVEAEPVILTLSSDDEDEPSKPAASPEKPNPTLSSSQKEPSVTQIKQITCEEREIILQNDTYPDFSPLHPDISIAIMCRTVRLGSYRFVPPEPIKIKAGAIVIQVPKIKNPKEIITLTIEKKHVVKVLVSFHKMLPVMFYYVMPSVGKSVREQLGMVEGTDIYFDPLSNEEMHKRITILPEVIQDDVKKVFKQIYGFPVNMMDELNSKEANDILMKTCPKELTKVLLGSSITEIKQLLIYPPGKGGLPINTEDYLCLAQDQFLNDVIIDFYLKYLVLQLPEQQQNKVHVFSTFFYKRLTTKPFKPNRKSHPNEFDTTLSPAQKRHSRVKNWTKNVNLFDKDFIIIPINEHSHWFLAIICFPSLDGTYTMDGKPIKIEPKKKRKKPTVATIGNVTITTVKVEKDEKPLQCEDGELSDKDEAEADESDLDSEDETEEPPQQQEERPPIKQPCILIFDSLAGASRSRVVATLRDYLSCEYKAKIGSEKVFTKDVIKGACPKVPQQTNFTDCGLYLLQYVEQFFKEPIRDYYIPISQLKNWFDELTVTKKREDISLLIKSLMSEYNLDTSILPELLLPTCDGKVIDNFEDEEEEDEETDQLNESMETENGEEPPPKEEGDVKEGEAKQVGEFLAEAVPNVVLRPDLSEIQKQSNRETMMYLKSKRIIRHKNTSDESDAKKVKTE